MGLLISADISLQVFCLISDLKGNVIVYPPGDWYGRVKTCHVSFLIDEALLKQKTVKDLWRGRLASGKAANDLSW
jgi:(2Fe-2S) ferredoxin